MVLNSSIRTAMLLNAVPVRGTNVKLRSLVRRTPAPAVPG